MPQRRMFMVISIVSACLVAGIVAGKPPGANNEMDPAAHDLGKVVYVSRCAPCHGESGRGDGPNAFFLDPKPRDFTTGVYKFRTTESGSIPTDADLERTITAGLPGTSMPQWGTLITGDTLKAIVSYVKAFSPRFGSDKPKSVSAIPERASSEASVMAGKKVFEKLQCGACHGTDGKGANAVTTEFTDDSGNPIRAANLTEPWTFHGGPTTRDVYLRFRTGIDGTPMPAYVGSASNQEMWDLANYVESMARKPVWEMSTSEVKDLYAAREAADRQDTIRHGRYLVNALGCAHCHTPVDQNGSFIPGLQFAGGRKWALGPYGTFVSYNLTSDSATGLGRWTDAQIKHVLTRGVRRDGSRMLPFPMSWTNYASLSQSDLDAIVAYLRTIPPVQNRIPDPQPLGFFPYVIEKFKMLILGKDLIGYEYPGNAGLSTNSEHSETSSTTGGGQ